MKKTKLVLLVLLLAGCSSPRATEDFGGLPAEGSLPAVGNLPAVGRLPAVGGLPAVGSMVLTYARQFRVDYLADGCSLITVAGSERFLTVPEGREPPRGIDPDIVVLRRPVENIYLAATSAMCLFDALDALDAVTLSGTRAEGWYIENARAAMESGAMLYAGRYSAPDYELIAAKKCGLAVQSTMILQTPEVKEKLEALGVSVLVERSSYETHPLGRTEWIKLYGHLLGKDGPAGDLFDEQAAYAESIPAGNTGKTAAFFYISSSGGAVVRKNGDYITKMIELAGGAYVFTGLESGGAAGSVNLNMERFYSEAKDADVLIYNSAVGGEVRTLEELLKKSRVIADFKAVRNGDVWGTSKNFFQETTGFGLVIADMHRIFTGGMIDAGALHFLYPLR